MVHSSESWEITLLYFFSWNCTWFGPKEPIKVQNFRLLTVHVKFHQICTLISSLKYIKLVVQRGYVSWPWRLMQNLTKNWSVVPKLARKWWHLTWAPKSLQDLHFHLLPLCKVFSVWAKKVQRGYLLRHWGVKQKLKKNWLWFVKWH